jgi:hypothetical protein
MRDTFSLFKDLQSELKNHFNSALFPISKTKPEEENKYCAPAINIGHLPPKRSMPANAEYPKTSDNPPFIVVRPWEGTQGKKNETKNRVHEIKIGFLCGIFSNENSEETEAGYNYILNMVDGVQQTLFSKYYWDENNWSIKESIDWKLGLQKELGIYDAGLQMHPFYGAVVIASFESSALEFPRMLGITDTKEK